MPSCASQRVRLLSTATTQPAIDGVRQGDMFYSTPSAPTASSGVWPSQIKESMPACRPVDGPIAAVQAARCDKTMHRSRLCYCYYYPSSSLECRWSGAWITSFSPRPMRRAVRLGPKFYFLFATGEGLFRPACSIDTCMDAVAQSGEDENFLSHSLQNQGSPVRMKLTDEQRNNG